MSKVSGSPLLCVSGVKKCFSGASVLSDISFVVSPGERIAIVGPSGVGKTTLLRLLAGGIAPDAGSITVDGHPPGPGQLQLAYQGTTLVGHRTALANVLVGELAAQSGVTGLVAPFGGGDTDRALELLRAVGLGDKTDTRVDQLSAGQRQRVAIARALLADGSIVLADEPTANLDPQTRSSILELLDTVVGSRPLLVALHDIELATSRFDRVIGMADGTIAFDEPVTAVTDGRLAELFADESEHQRQPSVEQSTPTPARHGGGWYG
ncbi:phosphonate ABC transporter ATP-binding protein [Halocatena halophila]|uniref:phosphonate ABC transporter ATP-binding protein n=1 Tax=Halocatena halophila TaxID=2814576 RepID=UPI002ED509F5